VAINLNSICNSIQQGLFRLFADWEVRGKENVPPFGSLIVVANHMSNMDPAVLSPSIPRRTWFLAKKEIFKGPAAIFLRYWGAYPLNRGRTDLGAFRWALSKLDSGQCIVLFPEGTRSPKGGMRQAQSGVTKLALSSGASILPVGITGSEHFGTWLRIFNPTGKLTVQIGRPFSLPEIEGTPTQAIIDSMTTMIMERIALQLPDTHRGVYPISPRVRQDG